MPKRLSELPVHTELDWLVDMETIPFLVLIVPFLANELSSQNELDNKPFAVIFTDVAHLILPHSGEILIWIEI